jgi:VWFA-related protein
MQTDPGFRHKRATSPSGAGFTSRREWLLSTAALLASPAFAWQDQEPTFSTGVKVVNILATVTTKKGEIVRDLSQEEFQVSENGRPQEIRYFSRDTDLPLTLGLLIDTSMSQRRLMEAERAASYRFIDHVLREAKDQVFLMQFDLGSVLRQPLTSSRKDLEAALTLVDTPTMSELQVGAGDGTSLYDTVIKASNQIMKQRQDRKALILLTDGVDNSSDATLIDAVEAAQRSDTLIYSILFADPQAYMFGGGGGRGVLQRLSKDTGGGFFEVSGKTSIDDIFAVIQDELRSQYSLGFVSDQPVRSAEFRKLQISTKRKGLVVRARDRYWATRL